MTSAIAVANIVSASGQAAAIVVLAALLVWVLRLDAPGVRYVVWRVVAVGCLLLPWVQQYRPAAASVVTTEIVTGAARASAPVAPIAGSTASSSVVVLAIIGAGVLLRLLWLLVGVVKLRHLRRSEGLDSATESETELQRTLGTRAEIYYSTRVSQPVTFGVWRPVILLPGSLRRQSADIQRAVIGHELIHVRRRDWAWLLVEETIVSVFWFHPAAWWVASQVQLAREEVVDELTVLLTSRRKSYVEALLAFSDPMSIVPTAAFARRRHLLRRIALISREELMSSRRIVASCAVMAFALPVGTWTAVRAFPLHAHVTQATQLPTGPGPLEGRAHTVTPENPVPRRIHYEEPVPPDMPEGTSAKVMLKITLDETGAVAEARPTGMAVKATAFSVELSGEDFARTAFMTGKVWASDTGVGDTVRRTVQGLVDSAITSVKQWRYDPPAQAPLTFSVSIRYGDAPEDMAFAAKGDKALRVGGAIKPPVKLVDVRPVYPQDAKAAHVSGVVIIEARIGADGSVEAAHVLRSIPLLDQAALDAVKQWKFVPTLMNGVPTPVIMTVTINFNAE